MTAGAPDMWRPPAPVERPIVIAFAAGAIFFLGYTLNIYNGALADRRALSTLCAAIACSAIAVLMPRAPLRPAFDDRLSMAVGLMAVLYGAYALANTRPVAVPGSELNLVLRAGIEGTLLLAVTSLFRRPPLGRLHVPLLLAVYFCIGVLSIHAAAVPSIDVYEFHREGLKALLSGVSPYSTTIPNLYGGNAAHFYGAGLVADGRVHVGYPYPPLNLFLALPGHLAGDYRYGLVAAIVIAAGFIAYLLDDRRARLGAVLLLFCPRVFFVCEQGWTEPFVVLTLACAIFCAARARTALPLAVAAFLASKQYAVLALPAVVLLFPRPIPWKQVGRTIAIAAVVACAVSLPFAVADPKGFADSVLLFQLRQPFRADSLSLLGKVPGALGVGSSFGLAAAVAALAVCLWRAPRSVAGFAGSLALVFLLFFALAKQAFWNYYFFAISALACAAGSAGVAAVYCNTAGGRRAPLGLPDRAAAGSGGGGDTV